MKRLFIDIETSQNQVLAWRAGARNFISYKDIFEERAIICAAYKWQGQKKVHTLKWDAKQNDEKLIQRLVPVLMEADEIIGHNIARFDLPWIRARALFHGIQLPLLRMVDTLKWARKYYNFNSNRLDYLGRFLGVGAKIEEFTEGKGSWRKVLLDNDRAELNRMVEYCANDVGGLLEPVYDKFAIVCPGQTHAGVVDNRSKWTCPHCASKHIYQNQRKVTAKGSEQYTMQCKDCHHYYVISKPTWEKWQKERFEP